MLKDLNVDDRNITFCTIAGKLPLGRERRILEGNNKVDLREIVVMKLSPSLGKLFIR
jgi:hypothetical protein